ncbi:sigma-54-dependent transcriptional regulator [Dyadobacter tibetensis]|uniref:sigma-54-dependent transcriptional regulator n=1 Tax=Dyadobacter tibetensis TaxID=1211851 RepID=UPI0004B7DAF7|nr:sigma-54 dependent transcriptional regulator [Dyadobacter tibetensis]
MPISKAKILIIDNDIEVLTAAKLLIKRHAATVDIEKNPENIPFLVTNGNYDIILLDMNYTGNLHSEKEGLHWLDKILDIQPLAKVIMITSNSDIELAVQTIKAGAADFIMKPWDNEKLLNTLEKALEAPYMTSLEDPHSISKNERSSEAKAGHLPTFVANSAAMRELMQAVDRVADTDTRILILGENGTGKTQLAQQIHYRSRRSDRPFIAVDLGSVNEELFESELFGHSQEAVTDALSDQSGRLEAATGGTLFLDEIGSLSPTLQAKLITVLQEQKVTRVGSDKLIELDFRLICATNMPLEEMEANQSFRQNLYYGMNTIVLSIPPLRERPEDIKSLADFYLNTFARKYNRPVTHMDKDLIKDMMHYHWPGNIRELQHAMERAVILSSGQCLDADTMQLKNAEFPEESNPGLDLEEMERSMIKKTLKKHAGNIPATARELELSRAALYRRIEKYRI